MGHGRIDRDGLARALLVRPPFDLVLCPFGGGCLGALHFSLGNPPRPFGGGCLGKPHFSLANPPGLMAPAALVRDEPRRLSLLIGDKSDLNVDLFSEIRGLALRINPESLETWHDVPQEKLVSLTFHSNDLLRLHLVGANESIKQRGIDADRDAGLLLARLALLEQFGSAPCLVLVHACCLKSSPSSWMTIAVARPWLPGTKVSSDSGIPTTAE
jgi:hypothetical protein